MKKLIIKDIDKYNITLLDKDKKEYKINIEFYDFNPSVDDVIYLSENVLKEKNIFSFGPLAEQNNYDDLIKIIHEGQEIYLQRYYG